jgi:hypothetical protein
VIEDLPIHSLKAMAGTKLQGRRQGRRLFLFGFQCFEWSMLQALRAG